jgi:TonB dependent receptor/Carboxypeptidase regulatory-like domain/TonB-dependent Receptor Plug Domain
MRVSLAVPPPSAWLSTLLILLSWVHLLSAQPVSAQPAEPIVPGAPSTEAPARAAPDAVPAAATSDDNPYGPEPPTSDGAETRPTPSEPVAVEAPEAAPPATLRVVIRAEPPGPPTDGVLIESDDGRRATTAADGSAEVELGQGPRSLRLTLPLPLTPGHAGPDPRVIKLEGIELGSAQRAELRVAIGPDGTPGSLELVALPPRATPVAPDPASTPAPGSPQQGQIIGTVTAKTEGTSVQGVSVFVEGSEAQATSDASGRFSLRVPAGRHTVWLIHENFPTLTLSNVDVRAGKDTTVAVELEAPTARTDDWVIRARFIAGGVASILEERRKASTVSDALGSEEISKSPDSSASSATRRIVGASIVGGQYLFARGLGGRYTNVRLNGVPLPSTDPDLPGFQLDLFPASLLSSLVITKTFSPDIPGDFAGGSLNVVTRAFPEKFKLTLSTSLTYNTETTGRRMPSYAGGGLDAFGIDDGTRALPDAVPPERVWGGGGLGVARIGEISRAFPNVWELDDRVALPNLSVGASLGDTIQGHAGRFGYLLTLGYRHRFERYAETLRRVGAQGAGDQQPAPPLETLRREIGGRDAQVGALGTASYEPNDKHRLSAVTLLTQHGEDRASFLTGLSEREGTDIRLRELRFIERRLLFNQLLGEHEDLGGLLTVNWQLNMARTLRDQPDTRALLYSLGPNGYAFLNAAGSGERLYTHLEQNDYGGGLDLRFSVTDRSTLKLGYLGRTGSRDFEARRFSSRLSGTAEDRLLEPEELLAPERATEGLWRIDEITLPADGFSAQENLQAGYAMFEGSMVEGVKVMLGVRAERFHQQIDVASPFAVPTQEAQPGADRTDLDYLLAASLVVAPRDDMNLRAAYGGTVARPLVRELAPFLSQDFVRRRATQGNPDLQRTFIHNFDLRWELFPTPTEVFAVSTFYKLFQRPIETVLLNQGGDITYQNIEGATSYGAEIEARVGMGLLSAALERFSVVANLALIESRVTLSEEQQGVATQSERALAGQSPYVANVSVGYDSEETSLSAYLFYNVFGRRIQDVGRGGLPDIYEEAFNALDATVFWKATSQITVGASASNILLQPTRVTQSGVDVISSERGANFGLSLSWSP